MNNKKNKMEVGVFVKVGALVGVGVESQVGLEGLNHPSRAQMNTEKEEKRKSAKELACNANETEEKKKRFSGCKIMCSSNPSTSIAHEVGEVGENMKTESESFPQPKLLIIL